MGTSHGHTALSVLLLQDLAIVPLLALVSLLAADTTLLEGIEFAILEAVLVIAIVILIGRFFLSPVLAAGGYEPDGGGIHRRCRVRGAGHRLAYGGSGPVARAGCISCWVDYGGLPLSAPGDCRYPAVSRHLVGSVFHGRRNVHRFQPDRWTHSVEIAGMVLGLLLIKSAILWVLCRLMGAGTPDATRVSLLLSQSGEFGFVLFGLAAISGVLETDLFQFLTLVIALTMVTTPLMANFGEYLGKRFTRTANGHDVSTIHIKAGQPHVIIAGFGRVGRRIARILQAGNVPYLAIESNIDRVLEGRRRRVLGLLR